MAGGVTGATKVALFWHFMAAGGKNFIIKGCPLGKDYKGGILPDESQRRDVIFSCLGKTAANSSVFSLHW